MQYVSRGLARESSPVPRFFNHPEIAFMDIESKKENLATGTVPRGHSWVKFVARCILAVVSMIVGLMAVNARHLAASSIRKK